jgi:hypothetical protein
MKRQRGIVLFMTLLLLGIVSALIVAQLEMVLLHQKATQQVVARGHLRRDLERLALHIMSSSSYRASSHCTMDAFQNPNEVVQQLKRGLGCRLTQSQQNYVYWVEDLGVQPCLYVMVQKVRHSTRHWRLTLAHDGDNQDYLQIRVAELVDDRLCHGVNMMKITPGVVSWRYWSEN